MNKNVGQYLKELREKKHLSQNQLANRLHISRSVIAKYETGEREPSFNILIILSKFFKIPITDLIPIYEQNIKSNNTKDVLNYLLKQNKTFRTIVLTLITIIFIIIVSAVIYINVLNYVSTKVYRVTSINNNPIIKDGLLIKTKDKVYLSLVSNLDPEKVEIVKFYYLDNEEKNYVFETSNVIYIKFYANLNDEEYISFKNYDKFFDDSLIEIHYKNNTTESVKLNYEFDYTNNSLEEKTEEITEKTSTELEESDIDVQTFNENKHSELNDIATTFMKEHNNEIFNVKLDGVNYEVSVVNDILNILYKVKDKEYSLSYSYILDDVVIKLDDITTTSKTMLYGNIESEECTEKECIELKKKSQLIEQIINKIKK